MAKTLSQEELRILSEKLKITANILSDYNNDFTLLDFEEAFKLPYLSVSTRIRNPKTRQKLELTDEETIVLNEFFRRKDVPSIKMSEERIETDPYLSFEFSCKDKNETRKVTRKECKELYFLLKEKGVQVTSAALYDAAKRYAFGEEILPYASYFSKYKTL